MKDLNISLVYFSPTGSSKKILQNIVAGMGIEKYKEIDLTDFYERRKKRIFDKNDLVLFGMPVYYGRLPIVAKEIFENIKGVETPVVPVVSYGNIVLDDALLELKNNLEKLGFKTLGAAAFIGEHSMNPSVAQFRPDDEDREKQFEFGRKLKIKYENIKNLDNLNIQVPGSFPYREGGGNLLAPQLLGDCKGCHLCSDLCPVLAIDPDDPSKVDGSKCILCFRCVRNCPNESRNIADEKMNQGISSLESRGEKRKEGEIFI